MKIRNSLFIVLSLFFFFATAEVKNDPVLMIINNNPIKKSEFEYIYNKNNFDGFLDKKTLNEYLDMFVDFKLKVEDAKEQKLDTTEAFVTEFSGYRKELIKPYLTDSDAYESVLKEAYERMKEDVEVSHILVFVAPDASPQDTLKAWKKIQSVKEKLKRQKFDTLARKFSEETQAAENAGYIGWITAFSTIYPFETQAYNTKIGATSDVFRTVFGYHILKVNNRRESLGSIQVGHIMTFTSRDDDAELDKAAKNRIDSLYQSLLQGADFQDLAKEYSEDRASAARGGELPWFRTGMMIPEFEKAAFGLNEPGEITKPLKTSYGWHIIKLLDKKGIAPFDELKSEIEHKIKRDERVSFSKDSFVEKLKGEYNFKLVEKNLQDVSKLLNDKKTIDSLFIAELDKKALPLFVFANKTVSQADFVDYLGKRNFSQKENSSVNIRKYLNEFIADELLAYEETQLENKYDKLKYLLQEYHDGILLFEISNLKIWDKASKDTAGLTAYFNKNKADYKWTVPHYKGFIVSCKDKKTQKLAKRIIKHSPVDSVFNRLNSTLNDSVQYVKVEKGLFAKGENEIVDRKIFKSKTKHSINEEFPYVFLVGKKLNYMPSDYRDVFGLIVSDYQAELEKAWIKSLREKYKIEIDYDVLKTVKEH